MAQPPTRGVEEPQATWDPDVKEVRREKFVREV